MPSNNAVGKKTRSEKPRPSAARGARRPGRPAGAENGLLDRKMILSVAFDLANDVPLADLSIVRLARELGVTPPLVHYYLGSRDSLTSGVMNAFYRELIEGWPKPRSGWRESLEVVASSVYEAHIRHPGIASYVVSHNRFRMVQKVEPGEIDYGILFFERFVAAVREAGFDARSTGVYAHLLIEFISAYAHATVAHRWPGEHSNFLNERLAELNPNSFPSAHFVSKSFTRLDAGSAFATGLRLFLHGLEFEREQRVGKRTRSRAASST